MIRVLLAEDQGMMRGALALLLGLEDDIEVVAQVSSGDGVIPAALGARPDVARSRSWCAPGPACPSCACARVRCA